MSSLTVRLTDREERDLQLACEQTGKTKSEVVRDLLAESLRGYRLRQALQKAHTELGGAARQAGWLTEEDILQDKSGRFFLTPMFGCRPQCLRACAKRS